MQLRTLVDVTTLNAHLDDPDWVVVDCRFALADPGHGRRAYLASHIPGAVYADLDQDLSGPILRGETGRHPLPSPESFAETLSSWGVDASARVVAYDDMGGAIAARLWWMLRWLGHDEVAVLDGGLAAWSEAGLATRGGAEGRARRDFRPEPRGQLLVDVDEVLAASGRADVRVMDARADARFRGEEEPIDPVAGHIPGAISVPFAGNLDERKHMRAPDELRARFERALGDARVADTIVYCGSGVTACHDLLALAHAGLGDARLYAGSWSHWILDESRPVATGP